MSSFRRWRANRAPWAGLRLVVGEAALAFDEERFCAFDDVHPERVVYLTEEPMDLLYAPG